MHTLGLSIRSGAARAEPGAPGCAAALGHLAYVLLRPLRHRMRYRAAIGELMPLDMRQLRDVGLSRWQIEEHALAQADRRFPPRGTAGEALLHLARAMARAMRSARERRRARGDLMGLSDHMLRDIGLPRAHRESFLYGMVRCWSDAYASMIAANESGPTAAQRAIAAEAGTRIPACPARTASDDRAARMG